MRILTIELVEHPRRAYSHPQDGLVRRIGKVGVPILLKLRAELGHLGRRGAPLDPRVNRASQTYIKSEGNHCLIAKCWPTCASRSVFWSFRIRRPRLQFQVNRKARTGMPLNERVKIYTPSIAPSSLRNIAARDCASSAAKYLKKRRLWSAYHP